MRRMILAWLVKKTWKSITIKDITKTFGDFDTNTRGRMREEAISMEKMELYQWLVEDLQRKAIQKIYTAKDEDQVIFGQASMLITLTIKETINKIAKLK